MIDFFLDASRLKLLLASAGALLAVLAALLIAIVYLNGALDVERAEHVATREKLETAAREGVRWKTAAEAPESKIPALQGEVRACLGREAQATADAVEREQILSNVQSRARAPAEREEVVDDATRAMVVDRLNRPL